MNSETANQKNKFYITTAIAYASRKPHIGNVYEAILTDAVARFHRMKGEDVFFLTGTDEHGQKIEELAGAQGITPQAYVDRVAGEIQALWDLMNISYDKFIRTTAPEHQRIVQNIFKRLYEKGEIYKNEYEGWYCVPCESFFTETQVKDGCCPDCGRKVSRTKEEAYFFRMSAYQDRLLKYIDEHPDFIVPESRKKEMVNNFLAAGLQDLCVSRTSFSWGIPVTFDDRHVIYVWVDALSNYITALGYDVNEAGELYRRFWPADIHIVGKDIMRFHTIYWPIILMALGEELPRQVFGHPWLLFGSDKMSKSKGNVLYADELAEIFGVDGVRYFCLAEMPYAADGNITPEALVTRYNTDLANNLGNLVSRTAAMTKKYFASAVPAPSTPAPEEAALDAELRSCAENAVKECAACMETLHVSDALDAVFGLFRRANKYIDETLPWALAKEPEKHGRLGTVLYNLLETVRMGACLLKPFLPQTAEAILKLLGTESSALSFGGLAPGAVLGEASPLFARLDEEQTIAALTPEEAPVSASDAGPDTRADKKESVAAAETNKEPLIDIEVFMQCELRAARVLACEPVPKSKKLLKLEVDLGYEKRQVVSGIAKWYSPEQLIGKTVALVANLKPAKLCGVESQGMILAAGEENVRVLFLDDATAPGERIR